jgi:hypothetical protein
MPLRKGRSTSQPLVVSLAVAAAGVVVIMGTIVSGTGLLAGDGQPAAGWTDDLPLQLDIPGEPAGVAVSQPTPDPNLLLPDLVTLAPENLYIEVNGAGDRLIRFDTSVINVGDGPLDMLGTYDATANAVRAIQRIQTLTGDVVEQFVGSFVFHQGHNHWHFEDFTVFELWSYRLDGSLDELLATTGKLTFCVIDSEPIDPPLADAPAVPAFGGCGREVQGISVGWADVYDSTIPGQQLDITDVPDGRYAVRSTTDPDNLLMETDETNNSVAVYIEISGLHVEVLNGV